MNITLLILLLLSFPFYSFAGDSLETDTSIGANDFIEEFSYSGSQSTEGKDLGWNWNLSYTYSKQTSPATVSSSEITDISSQFVGGFGYKDDWERGLNFTYSTTPAESLHDVGPSAYVGYTFHFKHSAEVKKDAPKKDAQDSADNEFIPSLKIKGSLAVLLYSENFTNNTQPTRNKLVKRALTTNSINQSDFELEADYSPLDWLTPKLSFTKYRYSKDVNNFINALDRPAAIRIGASNFSSTLSGFPSWSLNPGVTFYFLDTWNFEYNFTVTETQADHTKSYGNRGLLTDDLSDHVRLAAGIEHDSSVNSGVTNLALIQGSYSF